jgi:phenylacetate-CoA ligase
MIGAFVSGSLYQPLVDKVKRAPFADRLAEAERNLALDRSALVTLQRDKLRAIVAYAKDACPHYGRTLSRVEADKLDRDRLLDLPTIGKPDVFEGHEGMRGSRPRGRVFSGTTSGSTGIAMRFWQDSEHQAWVEACQWRGRRWWGLERGDLQLVLWSRPADNTTWTSAKAWAKYRLRNCIQVDTFQDFDARTVERLARVFERRSPALVYGYGSSIGRLAEALDGRAVRLTGKRQPKMVEYTADHLYPREREIAERVFGIPIATAYGASECGGVAQQCREGRLHLSVDQAVYEVVRADGSRTDEGEVGEIVLTTLNNFAMPLIRYKVGDLGSWSNERCACGSPLPVMKLQVGKSVDLVHTSFKNGVSAHVLDYINLYLMREGIRGVKQFFVEQRALDEFELRIVRDEPFEPRAVEIFVAKMKEYFGEGIEVRTSFVDAIPLEPTGKRRYFKRTFTPERAS